MLSIFHSQDILNHTISKQPLPWYKTLKSYYYRPEWELFDLKLDPQEMKNLVGKSSLAEVEATLKKRLMEWQEKTGDPWRCAPHGVLEDKGEFAEEPTCLSLENLLEL
jgi:N-sulfoglucosamine sulfohydrolase